MKSFYEGHSWTIVVEGFNHMIDTLAGKTEELIIMESDPNMLTWLHEWKRQMVDKVDSSFELWEDDDDIEHDCDDAPTITNMLQVPFSAQDIESTDPIQEL
jgi:hypothetical protein